MNIPAKVHIGGHAIPIEWDDGADWGGYSPDKKLIMLNEKLKQDPKGFTETLRHEMVHASFYISGVAFGFTDDQMEQIVRCLDDIFFPAWESVIAKARKHKNATA